LTTDHVLNPRVLIVGQGPPTRGGIPTFISCLLDNEWLRERVHIEYLNTTPQRTKHPAALNASNLILTLVHAWTIFRRARKADVVHLNLAPAPALPLMRALFLCAAAKAAGARVILHAHTGRLHLSALHRHYRALLRTAPLLVDAFVVVSKPSERTLQDLGVGAIRFENGIAPSEVRTGPKSSNPLLLTYVGTICERKGLIDLRDALQILKGDGSLPSLRVLLVGDAKQEGPDAEHRIRSAYAEAGLPGDVKFMGSLERPQVLEVLAASGIFCLPSHWEAFPLSLLEAMAAQTAVVATTVGDIPRILDGGRAGMLVEPHDATALAAAIKRLVCDPIEREQLARAARARVEQEYDFGKTAQAVFSLYRRLAPHSM
jgi:glycosyltransferase involved in cell wall biosynthesis